MSRASAQQPPTIGLGVPEISLNAIAGAGAVNGTAFSVPGNGTLFTWNPTYTGGPSAVSVALQGSLDNSTYFNIDTSTNTAGELKTISASIKFVRCSQVSRTGGTTTSCSITVKNSTPAGNIQSIAVGDGSLANPSYSFQNETGLGIYRPSTNILRIVGGGANFADFGASGGGASFKLYNGHFVFAADNQNDIGFSGANRPKNLYLGTSIKQVGTVTTTGFGTPLIVAQNRLTGQTAAVPTVTSFTVGAADGSFEVIANALATTSTSYSFDTTVTYTDESNTSRTTKMNMVLNGGNISNSAALTNAIGPLFQGTRMLIRCKSGTTITVATTGTFTTITYNVEATIIQIS